MSNFSHFSVLLEECIENLNIKPDGVYVDGTAGGAGHSSKIAERLSVTPAALSYHLRLLKSADLVIEYKSKNFVYYEINTTVLQQLIIWVGQFGGKGK